MSITTGATRTQRSRLHYHSLSHTESTTCTSCLSECSMVLQLCRSRAQASRRGPRQVPVQAAASSTAAAGQMYLCIDCGYIYDGRTPFSQLKDYVCPVCQAPKRRQAFMQRHGAATMHACTCMLLPWAAELMTGAAERRFKATKRPSPASSKSGPAAASGEGVDQCVPGPCMSHLI